jgi:ribonuclease HI
MIFLNTDGGARGNPGPSAIGFVIKDEKGAVLNSGGEYLGEATNNYAEYKALILGLTEALKSGYKTLTCRLDSELVVKQLNGEYSVKDMHLKDLYNHIQLVVKDFDYVSFHHVPRKENSEADKIVNKVLDEN